MEVVWLPGLPRKGFPSATRKRSDPPSCAGGTGNIVLGATAQDTNFMLAVTAVPPGVALARKSSSLQILSTSVPEMYRGGAKSSGLRCAGRHSGPCKKMLKSSSASIYDFIEPPRL